MTTTLLLYYDIVFVILWTGQIVMTPDFIKPEHEFLLESCKFTTLWVRNIIHQLTGWNLYTALFAVNCQRIILPIKGTTSHPLLGPRGQISSSRLTLTIINADNVFIRILPCTLTTLSYYLFRIILNMCLLLSLVYPIKSFVGTGVWGPVGTAVGLRCAGHFVFDVGWYRS